MEHLGLRSAFVKDLTPFHSQGWFPCGSDWAGHWNSACQLFQVSSLRSKWLGEGQRDERSWEKPLEALEAPPQAVPSAARPRKAPWGTAQGGDGAKPKGPWADLASQVVAKCWTLRARRSSLENPSASHCSEVVPSSKGHESPSLGQIRHVSHNPAFSRGCC